MRIVVVSAHYPPNFVSGGTLQPQRLARGLRDRGHDVSVYAGWLGPERVAGTSWTEHDETGMVVRWVATTPWTGWDDRRNFDNPVVAAHFDDHVAQIRPDVVHFHSLQTLGAGLLDAAARADAAVAVTMHDFWWCCARQFLVDRDMQPCSPVVAAGACDCSVDARWLAQRNRWLRDRLERADIVLTPSSSAAAVLEANGLAPDRLRVDENGMPEAALGSLTRRARPAPSAPVRFLYAGGSEEMKGVHVVFGACAQLRGLPGWTLRAHGAGRWVAEHDLDVVGSPVEVLEPFPPERTDEVLGDTDVLVLPSVMRESYSLLTREALARGVPVLTSDSVGPEEVVRDGVNGLVVPAGDATVLAAAMRRLVTDPDLLTSLQSGAGGIALRPLDDQVRGLESKFDEVLQRRGRLEAPRGGRAVERVLFIVGIDGAPLRYRAHLPAEALALLGVQSRMLWFTDPRLHEAIAETDAVVVYRSPATPHLLDALARARDAGIPILFDADDLIFDPGLAEEIPALKILAEAESALWLEGVHRYRTTMEASDLYIASTAPLARHAEAVTGLPVERFDNGVGLVLARAADRAFSKPRSPGPPRIGYFSGTDTHDHDWAMVEPAVTAVLDRHPIVELWLGGHLPETPALDRFGGRVRRIPFQPWRGLPALLHDLDINLSPLEADSRFNEAKSAIKWLEAALVATPTIASPTPPFRDAIEHGRTGLLATTVDEWEAALEVLLGDDLLRRVVGERARRAALLRWSPHLQARRYLAILERAKPRAAADTGWVPVLGGEAVHVRRVERYDPELRPEEPDARSRSIGKLVGVRLADTRVRLADSRRRNGTAGALLRIPGAAARAVLRRLRKPAA